MWCQKPLAQNKYHMSISLHCTVGTCLHKVFTPLVLSDFTCTSAHTVLSSTRPNWFHIKKTTLLKKLQRPHSEMWHISACLSLVCRVICVHESSSKLMQTCRFKVEDLQTRPYLATDLGSQKICEMTPDMLDCGSWSHSRLLCWVHRSMHQHHTLVSQVMYQIPLPSEASLWEAVSMVTSSGLSCTFSKRKQEQGKQLVYWRSMSLDLSKYLAHFSHFQRPSKDFAPSTGIWTSY